MRRQIAEDYLTTADISPEVLAARDSLNYYSGSELNELLDESLYVRSVAGDRAVSYALLDGMGNGQLDTSKVIVMPHPYANGWAKHMLMRGLLLHGALDSPHPILALPNATAATNPYQLTAAELDAVKHRGDLSPIANIHAAIAESVQHRYKADDVEYYIDGYSQGASIGAVLAGKIATKTALLAEAPNIANRTSGEHREEKSALSKAFKKGGLGPLNRAVADSQLPELSRAQGVSNSGRSTAKQLLGMGLFGLNTLKLSNRALSHGMAHPNFRTHLRDSLEQRPEMNITIARAIGSLIMTEEHSRYVQLYFDGSEQLSYVALDNAHGEPYGHAAGDNLPLHAEAFRRSVYGNSVS